MSSSFFDDYTIIATSGLFDPEYYVSANPDVAASGIDPLVHYIERGAAEGRKPNPAFDPIQLLSEGPGEFAVKPRVRQILEKLKDGLLARSAPANDIRDDDLGLVAHSVGQDGSVTGSPRSAIWYRGWIDVVDHAVGIRGWAVDIRRPGEPLTIQLCVGGHVLAEYVAQIRRNDVAAAFGAEFERAGFAFAPEEFNAAAALPSEIADQPIWLAIAAGEQLIPLRSARPFPSARQFLSVVLGDRAGRDADLLDVAPAEPLASDINLAIRGLHQAAMRLSDEVPRLFAENLSGYVEAIAVDDVGNIWILGWLNRGCPLEFPALIVDRDKYPAAIVLTSYERDDLPSDAISVFGVVKTDWRPRSRIPEFVIYIGPDARQYIRGASPLRLLSVPEILGEFEQIKPLCRGARSVTLQRMLVSTDLWMPGNGRVAGFPVEAGVDKLIIIPAFGCVMEGWIFSPLKPVERLAIKFGNRVLTSEPSSTYFKPRVDLRSGLPGYDQLTDRAGVVATFLGRLPTEDCVDPILKVIFTDGTAIDKEVDPKALRRLNHSMEMESLLALYPSLPDEPYFVQLADAICEEQRLSLRPIVLHACSPAERVLVIVLPQDRSDGFLLLEEIVQWLPVIPPSLGLAFIADHRQARDYAMRLFAQRPAALRDASLVLVDDADFSLYHLPEILKALGANSFSFVDRGIALTDRGWEGMLSNDKLDDHVLQFWGLQTAVQSRFAPSEERSFECFSWSTEVFMEWIAKVPMVLGGVRGEAAICLADRKARLCPNGATRVEKRNLGQIARLINQVVLAAGAYAAAVR